MPSSRGHVSSSPIRTLPEGWRPLLSEAAIATSCLEVGLPALRKANHMQRGLYIGAFVNLSVGLERLLKLIVLIDWVVEHAGTYPSRRVFKKHFGHDLEKLFMAVGEIRSRRADAGDEFQWNLIEVSVATSIVRVLSDFAKSTRYYNLDYLTSDGGGNGRDPVEAWFTEVGGVLEANYPPGRRVRDEADAAVVHELVGPNTLLLQETENGQAIHDLGTSLRHARFVEYLQTTATFHCATIVRYLAEALRILIQQAHADGLSVPFLHEFFVIYENSDRYLRYRKTFA